ncbi:SDR family NAD(P)-dependent oxidoreductase [Chloroflexota bacterium]
MDFGLKDKVAIITGTASQIGMGKAVALTLAKEGCNIIASDIVLEGAEQTAAEIEALGRKVIAFKVDVANSAEVSKMVKTALKEFGKIDILANIAGVTTFGGNLVDMKEEDCDKEINVNLKGGLNCARAVLPNMIERKYGKIVSISSVFGRIGIAGGVIYSAAKDGVIGFTKALAREVGHSGINVNAIAPGLVLTNMPPNLSPEMVEANRATTPTGRITTTEDIANALAFLASDVSKNITGQTISVDGGTFMF